MKAMIETQPDGITFRVDNDFLDALGRLFAPLGAIVAQSLVPQPTRQFQGQAVNAIARSSLQLFTDDELRAYRRAVGRETRRRKRHRRRLARVRRTRGRRVGR